MANLLLILAEGAAEHGAAAAEHAAPSALGLSPSMWVAASMTVLILIAPQVAVDDPKRAKGAQGAGHGVRGWAGLRRRQASEQ